MIGGIKYFHYAKLRQSAVAWRLLCASHAPFIIDFLHREFIASDRRSLPYQEVVSLLDDYLHGLRLAPSAESLPRTAKEYIDQWSSGEAAFLSLRYNKSSNFPEVDLSAGAEKAIRWVQELEGRDFVGTESRLLTIFRLMEDLVQHTETDQQKVLERLHQKKAQIEAEIRQVESGVIATHDSTQIKERFFQIEDLIRQLLGDFRQVEETFRGLDRQTRERAVTSSKEKGAFLDEIFGEHDAIHNSDQGKSFKAFWTLLLRGQVKEEFGLLLDHLLSLREAQGLSDATAVRDFFDSLLMAGGKIKRVTDQLTSQMRKYLDDRALIESRRVMELAQSVETKASTLSPAARKEFFIHIDPLYPELNMELSRPLFDVGEVREIESVPEAGEVGDVSLGRLFDARGVDEARLKRNIERLVASSGQVTLKELLTTYPPEKGLAELIVYLKLASERRNTVFSDEVRDVLRYRDVAGAEKLADLEQVIFVKDITHAH